MIIIGKIIGNYLEVEKVQIFSIDGRLVFESKTAFNEAKINTSAFAKGTYILKFNLIINENSPLISQFKALEFNIKKADNKYAAMIDQRPNTAIIHGKWSFNKIENKNAIY